jgi:anti-sigma B factor antagonist
MGSVVSAQKDEKAMLNPAPFKIDSQVLDGIHVMGVHGELDLNTAPQLAEPLDAALASERSGLVIDLSDCEFIDSTGIALIVRAWQRVDGDDAGGGQGRFALCCVNDQVQRLFDITGLESAIPTHKSREDALAELRG